MSDKDALYAMLKRANPQAHTLDIFDRTETMTIKTVNGRKVQDIVDVQRARIEYLGHGMDSNSFTFEFDENDQLCYIRASPNRY